MDINPTSALAAIMENTTLNFQAAHRICTSSLSASNALSPTPFKSRVRSWWTRVWRAATGFVWITLAMALSFTVIIMVPLKCRSLWVKWGEVDVHVGSVFLSNLVGWEVGKEVDVIKDSNRTSM